MKRIKLLVLGAVVFGSLTSVNAHAVNNCGAWMVGMTPDEVEDGCAAMGQPGVSSCLSPGGTEHKYVCQCIQACSPLKPVSAGGGSN